MAIKLGNPAAPPAETRFDRAAALILAGTLAFVALVVAVTVGVLSLPADGWQLPGALDTNQLVYFYGDWPTPLRAGDDLRAVNGLSVDNQSGGWLRRFNVPGWRAGASIIYTVRRGEQVLEVPVELHQPDLASILRALAAAARDTPSEWSWPIVALVVFWLRPGSHAARLLFFVMLSYAAVVKVGWAAAVVATNFSPPWLFYPNLLTSNFWLWLYWPTILWLVLSFPRPVFPLSRWPRRVVVLLYVVPSLCFALTLLTLDLTPFTVGLVGELALLLVALIVAVISAYRRQADAVARAQVAWIILGFAVSQGLSLAAYLIDYFRPFFSTMPAWLAYPFPLALPICLGIAITRYHLFDVDIIIRRTLLYSVLTALLAAVYFGSVVLLQGLLTLLTGAARSELVTVLSTLFIAALFVPLRGRLQGFIDRRFFRRKYDSAQTLAAFGAALRDEVDLERLNEALVSVVNDTMQPESAQLWLARANRPGPGEP